MTAAWTAAGTPAQCAEHLHELIKARAKAIALRITGWDQKAQFERLAGEVVPLIEDW
jgi:alkanesulfonate monooxygenase SsuD/methylene tetrahydromethanopterin reductase-like flavin-dependent oxidoreductase (luciferase family)